jgi:hypothetical protein
VTIKEKQLTEELRSLIEAGLPMSNWLYNQAQQFNFAVYKGDMQQMVRQWDATVSRVRSRVTPPQESR